MEASSADWPPDIRQNYEPIRILGQGGFASVLLARYKPQNNNRISQRELAVAPGDMVAIKVAGSAKSGVTKQEVAYGHREIDILRAISHPNIMKCLDYAEPSVHTPMILVLSYSKGPTVESLLKRGGALSTIFGRIVTAQLVDALTYLHSHAVIHRDLKPDNIIVTGAWASQSDIWDNPDDYPDDDGLIKPTSPPDWEALRRKWHVTLIDFGFARALTKNDVHQPSPELKRENMDASFHQSRIELQSLDASGVGQSRKSLNRSLTSSLRESPGIRASIMFHRQMSALGSPQFAAPEIKNKVRKKAQEDLSTSRNTDDITKTISSFVADYGLLVDAYSLGCTIRYMMTGCPPHQSVADAIASQNSIVGVLCGMCGRRGGTVKDGKAPRTPRYRLVSDLPGEVQRLIEKLTVLDETQRASVRAARRYNWINDVLPADDEGSLIPCDPAHIKYLDFSKAAEDHAKHTPITEAD